MTEVSFFRFRMVRPMAWFFFSNVMVPNLSTVLFYYQTEVLQLESSFLGTVRVIGWLSLMFGAYIYNCYLKHKRLRSLHIGLALICFLDVVLVSQVHIQFGIPDKYMVLWGSAFGDAINQFNSTLGSFFGAALASVLDISSENFDNLLFGIVMQLVATLLPIGFLFLIPKEAT
ncbi:putative folate-biopterin transporter 4, partial [Ananas comosus]